jgi:hypothetical protein
LYLVVVRWGVESIPAFDGTLAQGASLMEWRRL